MLRKDFNKFCFAGAPIFPLSVERLKKIFRNDVANENWEISEEKLNMELRKSHGRIFPPKDNVSEVIDKAGISGDRVGTLVFFWFLNRLNGIIGMDLHNKTTLIIVIKGVHVRHILFSPHLICADPVI